MTGRKGRIVRVILGIALVLLLSCGGFFLLQPRPPKPPEAVTHIGDVEGYLDDLVEYGTPPGISVAVVKDGELVYSRAFGLADGPNNIPAAPETTYHWWSMTKIPTAIAILQLQEQGLLSLDDPVADYLSFFDVTYPSATSQPVTIRQLLNHSSGLQDAVPAIIGWVHHADEPPLNQTELIKAKLPDYSKLQSEPGDKSAYTNVGYMVLGAVIEQVSGQSYEDYVRQHILQPLAMDQTDFVYSDAMLANAAAGSHPAVDIQAVMLPFLLEDSESYIRERAGGKMWFYPLYSDQAPPTGLIGPVPDVARLMMAFLNGGELDGQRILAEESVRAMTYESRLPTSDVEASSETQPMQGLGWHLSEGAGRMYLSHDGGGPGFGTGMRVYPEEGLGVVVMANDTTYDRGAILDLLASLDW